MCEVGASFALFPAERRLVGAESGRVMASVKKDPKTGAWLARWRDPSGRQRKKSFRRRLDADRFVAEVTTQISRGSYVDPVAGKMSVGAAAEQWASGLAHLKPSTAERYRRVVQRQVIPKWGSWQLSKVSSSDVSAWLGELTDSGLSAGTVRKAHLVLSMVFDAAVEDRRIGRNPAKGVRLPRQVRDEARFLSAQELRRLVDAAGDEGLHIAVLGLTGLRFGEFAALRVSCLDVERRRLKVFESVSVVGSELVWSTTKTHKSRSVPVPPSLVDALAQRCQGRDGDELMFTSPMGEAIRLNNWRRRVFAPACERAGLSGLTPHDLRHTAASLAIQAGANVKAVQRMLGHGSAAMTLDVYAGLFPDDLDAVGESMDALVPFLCHREADGGGNGNAPASDFAEYRDVS